MPQRDARALAYSEPYDSVQNGRQGILANASDVIHACRVWWRLWRLAEVVKYHTDAWVAGGARP